LFTITEHSSAEDKARILEFFEQFSNASTNNVDPPYPNPLTLKGTLFQNHDLYATEDLVSQNFDMAIDEVRAFFKANDFALAETALDLLLEKKNGKTRADKKTPDAVHELQQVCMLYSIIKSGLISKDFEKDLKGSPELLFSAVLLHDIGEDFNIYREDLVTILTGRLKTLKGDLTKADHNMIDRAADIMELMTHERQYKNSEEKTAEEILRQDFDLDDTYKLPTINDFMENSVAFHEKAVRIPVLEEKVRERMKDVKPGTENLQVYATLEKAKPGKSPKVMYVITRYGMGDRVGTDWNKYINEMQTDVAAIFCKYIDRINGLATRIGVGKFNFSQHLEYLRRTYDLFGLQNTTEEMKAEYPSFAKAFDATDSILGLTHKVMQILTNNVAETNPEGGKGFDPSAVEEFSKNSKNVPNQTPHVPALKFWEYFEKRLPRLEHIPRGFTPIYMILARLRDIAQTTPEAVPVFNAVQTSLIQEANTRGFHGLEDMLHSFDSPI